MAPPLRALLSELNSALQELYGPRLRGAYLFGSHARGDAEADSVVDILVVLDQIESYSREIEPPTEVVSRLSLAHGRSISRVFASVDSFRRADRAFLEDARTDAVPL